MVLNNFTTATNVIGVLMLKNIVMQSIPQVLSKALNAQLVTCVEACYANGSQVVQTE